MKSLCTAAWLLTVAFGNMVVVIIAESTIFSNQVHILFIVIAPLLLTHSRPMSFSFLLLL